MERLLFIRFFVAAIYLAAAVLYIILLRSGQKQARAPTVLFKVGLIFHAVEIVVRGAESGAAGGAPFVSISGFLSISAFLLGIIYLFLEWRYRRARIASLGAFHVPVLFVLHICSCFIKQPIEEVPTLFTGPLFVVHVGLTLFAYAAFAVSFITGVTYLLLDRQLRQRRYGVLMRGLPNLEFVERVNTSSVKMGLPLLATGTVIGLTMAYRVFGDAYQWDSKVWITIVSIGIFSLQLVLRKFAGWTGRRAVIISVLGFIVILLSATVVNLLLSTVLHGFS
jgi:ABC-type uncharacterized transport system permease subunit